LGFTHFRNHPVFITGVGNNDIGRNKSGDKSHFIVVPARRKAGNDRAFGCAGPRDLPSGLCLIAKLAEYSKT
jgi:hypothetical protein